MADIPHPNGYYCQLTHAGQNYAARKVERSLLMEPTRLVSVVCNRLDSFPMSIRAASRLGGRSQRYRSLQTEFPNFLRVTIDTNTVVYHSCSHATAALNPFILVYSTPTSTNCHNHVIEICCALRQLVRAAACCLYARICMIRWQGLDVHNTSRLGRILEVPWTSLASSPKTSYLSSLRRRARIWLTAAALHFSALGLILLPWHSSILW